MPVDITVLRYNLTKWARRYGSPDPEGVAQAVMTKAMELGLTHTWAYWMVAARNETFNQQRQPRSGRVRSLDLMLEEGLFDVEDPHDSEPRFILTGPDADWLRVYYSKTRHSGAERIMALRKRNRLKAQVKKASVIVPVVVKGA